MEAISGAQTLFLQCYFYQMSPTSGPQTPRILGLSQPAGNERPPTAKKTPAEVKSIIRMEYNWDGGDGKCYKEF